MIGRPNEGEEVELMMTDKIRDLEKKNLVR
jgi:hypothetical protein